MNEQDCVNRVKNSFNNDSDIQEISLKVSMKCPLSQGKMNVPVRGKLCKHLQCFDLGTYLQMNKNHPKFNCPVCSKSAVYEDLFVDSYFSKILKVTLTY